MFQLLIIGAVGLCFQGEYGRLVLSLV